MNIRELYNYGRENLKQNQIDDYDLIAKIIIERIKGGATFKSFSSSSTVMSGKGLLTGTYSQHSLQRRLHRVSMINENLPILNI
mgnify:CR=1 FL=1